MDKARVLVADKNSFVADGICAILKNQDIDAIGASMTPDEVLKTVKEQTPDVVLMDMAMTDGAGAGIISTILQENGKTRVLLMTEQEDKGRIIEGFKMGGNGCIPKRASSTDLAAAVLSVQKGGFYLYPSVASIMVNEYSRVLKELNTGTANPLTEDEEKVLKALAEGRQNREIARLLSMPVNRVARHKTRIQAKLKLHNQADLIKYAIRNHIIEL